VIHVHVEVRWIVMVIRSEERHSSVSHFLREELKKSHTR
jgi:hypothetical protein